MSKFSVFSRAVQICTARAPTSEAHPPQSNLRQTCARGNKPSQLWARMNVKGRTQKSEVRSQKPEARQEPATRYDGGLGPPIPKGDD